MKTKKLKHKTARRTRQAEKDLNVRKIRRAPRCNATDIRVNALRPDPCPCLPRTPTLKNPSSSAFIRVPSQISPCQNRPFTEGRTIFSVPISTGCIQSRIPAPPILNSMVYKGIVRGAMPWPRAHCLVNYPPRVPGSVFLRALGCCRGRFKAVSGVVAVDGLPGGSLIIECFLMSAVLILNPNTPRAGGRRGE